jgi:N6-L-threonylcarbamoyladenine synthase
MKILAIETSCDETAAAILEEKDGKIIVLSNIINSQIKIHQETQGVVPEVAARAHIENIIPVVEEALNGAKVDKDEIDSIAVTVGPGLVGSLLVGVNTAKTLACIWNKPIYGVNHLIAHVAANFIEHKIQFPLITMTASGGHTMLLLMNSENDIKLLGETLDDAAGEAFDKVARLLNLGYPGGPEISKAAKSFSNSNKSEIIFPRPLANSKDYNFSFSGLKTAVLYQIKGKYPDLKIDNEEYKNEIAYQFEEAVTDVLVCKALKAADEFGAKTVALSGGVAANMRLREKLDQEAAKINSEIQVIYPSLKYCTDNAAMIGAAVIVQKENILPTPWEKIKADPNLQF